MKKQYVSPFASEINIEAKHHLLLSASLEIMDKEDEVDSMGNDGSGGQLTSGNRREWGNLWK